MTYDRAMFRDEVDVQVESDAYFDWTPPPRCAPSGGACVGSESDGRLFSHGPIMACLYVRPDCCIFQLVCEPEAVASSQTF